MTWADSITRSQCFPTMPLYLGLIQILSLMFSLPSEWYFLYSLSLMACLRCTSSVGTSWLPVRNFYSDSPQQSVLKQPCSRLKLELRRTSLSCCNFPCNHFASVQTRLKTKVCNFDHDPWLWKTKINDARYYVAGNSNFSKTRSNLMETTSSGFPLMSYNCYVCLQPFI